MVGTILLVTGSGVVSGASDLRGFDAADAGAFVIGGAGWKIRTPCAEKFSFWSMAPARGDALRTQGEGNGESWAGNSNKQIFPPKDIPGSSGWFASYRGADKEI